MLKRISIKKIMIASTAILLLLIMYLIPDNRNEIVLKNSIEYVKNDIVDTIYLIDTDNYVARTSIISSNGSALDKANELIEGLIIDGKKSSIIPNGFRSIIPPGTNVLNLELNDSVLTIDFSKDILDVNENEEEKMIEAIIYTLTNIDGVDKIIIKVEGEVLNRLPNSKKIIPDILDKNYGINKNYDLTTLKNIESYTVYYVNKYNDIKYYVPVTKYVNNDDIDAIKVVIKELSSSPIYQTNLMSYLNASAVLNDYSLEENNLRLDFNEGLLTSIDSNKILEEVIYTIGLSVNDIYSDLEKVSFYVNNEEIYTLNIDDIN